MGAATVLSAALLLAACGDDGAEQPVDPDGTAEVADGMPTASAALGSDAAITFPDGEAPEGLQVEVLSEGDGETVAEGAVLLADYAGHVWGNGDAFDSSFERGEPTPFSLNSVVQGWSQGIPDHPIGSRLLISIPPELGYGPQGGNAQAGIGAEDTIVFVVDLIDGVNPADTGSAEAEEIADPDQIPVSLDGGPGEPVAVTVHDDAEEPDEPTMEVLAEGNGEVVAMGDAVVVAYSVASWDNDVQQSTWPDLDEDSPGPELAHLGQGYWPDLLVDVPVGSRVLVTLPSNESSGPMAVVADLVLAHRP